MNFKEWLHTTEMRKPYRDYMQRMFPDMPLAVRHELGTNTVVPQLKKIAASSPPSGSPGGSTNLGTTVPYEPRPANPQQFDPNQSTISYHPAQQASPYNSPQELLDQNEKVQKFQSAEWPDKPQIVTIRLEDLDPKTQDTIKVLKFGYAQGIPVKRHNQRMSDQETLMQDRGSDDMEPVIMIRQADGLELLEGWHRVMNYLLSGAPPEIKQALISGETSAYDIEYDKWRPVKIKAYVGLPKKAA